MLDVEFYRLYNGLWAHDLMPCLCRDFLRFSQKSAMIFYCTYSYQSKQIMCLIKSNCWPHWSRLRAPSLWLDRHVFTDNSNLSIVLFCFVAVTQRWQYVNYVHFVWMLFMKFLFCCYLVIFVCKILFLMFYLYGSFVKFLFYDYC